MHVYDGRYVSEIGPVIITSTHAHPCLVSPGFPWFPMVSLGFPLAPHPSADSPWFVLEGRRRRPLFFRRPLCWLPSATLVPRVLQSADCTFEVHDAHVRTYQFLSRGGRRCPGKSCLTRFGGEATITHTVKSARTMIEKFERRNLNITTTMGNW